MPPASASATAAATIWSSVRLGRGPRPGRGRRPHTAAIPGGSSVFSIVGHCLTLTVAVTAYTVPNIAYDIRRRGSYDRRRHRGDQPDQGVRPRERAAGD